MKNLRLLPEDLQDRVTGYAWECGCGQGGLRLAITRKGKIQGHCFCCGTTIFWNDLQLFYFDPFCYQEEEPKISKTKNGYYTAWYANHRVRTFFR